MDEYRMINDRDVFSFLSAFTLFIKNAFNFLFEAVRKHVLIVAVTFLSVMAIGGYYWYTAKATYEAKLICVLNTLGHKTYGQMVQQLDQLAHNKSYNKLSETLHMPIALCEHIVSIDGRNQAGSLLSEDPTGDSSPMYFTVKTTDNRVFAPLQKAMLDYMNSGNPFRAKRDTLETESINLTLASLKDNVAFTDSFINAYTYYVKNNTNRPDSVIMSQNILQLLQYRRDLDSKIKDNVWRIKEMQQYVELYNGFIAPDHPSKNDKKIIVTTISSAVLLALFLAILAHINLLLKKEAI